MVDDIIIMNNKLLKTKTIFLSAKRGFSLMELLLVVAITLIASAAIFSSNNSKKASSEVESAARQVAAHLRSLQNEALTGKQIGPFYAGEFSLRAAGGPVINQYIISYEDSASNPIPIGAQTFSLSSKKVRFNFWTNVVFEAPLGKPIAARLFTIESQRDGGATKYYVCVSSAGNIVESKTPLTLPACN